MKRVAFLLFLCCLLPSLALAQGVPATQCTTTALAGGTPDALTVPKLPCLPTTTLLILTASAPNATTTPTLQPIGLPAQVIKRSDLTPLTAGDIPAAGARMMMTNTGSNWVLFNPAIGVLAGFDITKAFPSSFGNMPIDVTSINVGGFSAASQIPAGIPEALAVKLLVPSSYTQQPFPACSICSYVSSANAVTGESHTAYLGFAGSNANGSNPYGANLLVTNSPTFNAVNGSGFDGNIFVGLEIDANIMKKSSTVPTGILYGLYLIGASETLPASNAVAIEIEPLNTGTGLAWGTGINSTAGALSNFAQVGEATTANTVGSQPIIFRSKSGGIGRAATISSLSGGDISLAPASGASISLAGVLSSAGTAPTVSACGGSPSITSNSTSVKGVVTPGSGGPTSCVITFHAGDYSVTPTCTVSASDVTKTVGVGGATSAAITVNMTAGLATSFNYHCVE